MRISYKFTAQQFAVGYCLDMPSKNVPMPLQSPYHALILMLGPFEITMEWRNKWRDREDGPT